MTRNLGNQPEHFDLHGDNGVHNVVCSGRTVDFDLHDKALKKHLEWHKNQSPAIPAWGIHIVIYADDLLTSEEALKLAKHEAKLAARRHRRNDRVLRVAYDALDYRRK